MRLPSVAPDGGEGRPRSRWRSPPPASCSSRRSPTGTTERRRPSGDPTPRHPWSDSTCREASTCRPHRTRPADGTRPPRLDIWLRGLAGKWAQTTRATISSSTRTAPASGWRFGQNCGPARRPARRDELRPVGPSRPGRLIWRVRLARRGKKLSTSSAPEDLSPGAHASRQGVRQITLVARTRPSGRTGSRRGRRGRPGSPAGPRGVAGDKVAIWLDEERRTLGAQLFELAAALRGDLEKRGPAVAGRRVCGVARAWASREATRRLCVGAVTPSAAARSPRRTGPNAPGSASVDAWLDVSVWVRAGGGGGSGDPGSCAVSPRAPGPSGPRSRPSGRSRPSCSLSAVASIARLSTRPPMNVPFAQSRCMATPVSRLACAGDHAVRARGERQAAVTSRGRATPQVRALACRAWCRCRGRGRPTSRPAGCRTPAPPGRPSARRSRRGVPGVAGAAGEEAVAGEQVRRRRRSR